jgi:hypothetical protein
MVTYEGYLDSLRWVTIEQARKLRARNPEVPLDELRTTVIRGMRTALAHLLERFWCPDWEYPRESLISRFCFVVDCFRSLGVSTDDPLAQESLMVEIQKTLDECLV